MNDHTPHVAVLFNKLICSLGADGIIDNTSIAPMNLTNFEGIQSWSSVPLTRDNTNNGYVTRLSSKSNKKTQNGLVLTCPHVDVFTIIMSIILQNLGVYSKCTNTSIQCKGHSKCLEIN